MPMPYTPPVVRMQHALMPAESLEKMHDNT